MWVDFHWHSRDEEEADKESVLRSLMVAEAAGLCAIAAMPNTKKPLITLERCVEYLSLADSYKGPVKFYVHIGLTSDLEQVKRAVEIVSEPVQRKIFGLRQIIGLKAYWGRSTNDLSIIEEEAQYCVLDTLAKEGFDGVLVGHFEDEEECANELYDPKNPRSWNELCRPEVAEQSSFRKIFRMAEDVKFPGRLHVAHVSTLEVADAVWNYDGPVKLSCDVSLHHVVFNDYMLVNPDGAQFKCNPPLRSEDTRLGLFERLMKGRIPILISDHAPHTAASKLSPEPPSGIASGTAWPYVIQFLRHNGVSEGIIREVAFENAVKLYGLKLEPHGRRVDWKRLEELQKEYSFDAFKGVK
ncbi:hypothetical protein KY309_00100 [Candidatus Woesearchaeota archaeon]|nr:hypothetical protein [Candidatus Woesearchaeota archaeon]MBW3015993.1 hypothetical protein [Candidatus Woesearchaeota archaeon]